MISSLSLVVSIDGLQPEHDARRKPATYERILQTIQDSFVTVHCTVTGQITGRPGYLEEFMRFWSERPRSSASGSASSRRRGSRGARDSDPRDARRSFERVTAPLSSVSQISDEPEMIEELRHPPQSPEECIFARTTKSLSADLETR